MNIYLVQHAEPKLKKEDPDRPLTKKGWSDISKMASFLAEAECIKVTSILHSGKTRARQTAGALADKLYPKAGIKITDGLKPMDDPAIWVKRLEESEEAIMLVGHLPHLSKLASLLLYQDENKGGVDFQMGGVVCLEKDESGIWSVSWAVVPQLLV
jgi:phosphohistidine phosphatase